ECATSWRQAARTGRQDACGLAQLLRMGWFQQVHAKSMGSQEIRALLVARKQLRGRLLDVELSIPGILRGFGLKVATVEQLKAKLKACWQRPRRFPPKE